MSGGSPRASGRTVGVVVAAALDGPDLLGEDAGEIFDRINNLAAASLRVPAAMVDLIDAHRRVTRGQVGAADAPRDVPRDRSICRQTAEAGGPLSVPDLRVDARTLGNPAVQDLGLVAYLGVPLTTSAGLVLGCLCVIDTEPRTWSARDIEALKGLAVSAIREIEARAALRRERDERRALQQGADESARDLMQANDALGASEYRHTHLREQAVALLAGAIELRSEETGLHIQGVARFSEMIARDLGIPADDVRRIALASKLHDVGKIAMPDAILHKPGPLTPRERAVMQTHARIGYDMLAGSGDDLFDLAAQIALTHHERVDGQGYPQGLGGQEIPIAGRIVAVADAFDALTSVRCYRPPLPIQRALTILREERGAHFDPSVLDVLLAEVDPGNPAHEVHPRRP